MASLPIHVYKVESVRTLLVDQPSPISRSTTRTQEIQKWQAGPACARSMKAVYILAMEVLMRVRCLSLQFGNRSYDIKKDLAPRV